MLTREYLEELSCQVYDLDEEVGLDVTCAFEMFDEEKSEAYLQGYFDGISKNQYFSEKLITGACCVYLISDGEHVKIGISDTPFLRIKELQTGSPRQLHIIKLIPFSTREQALKTERFLHNRFSEYRQCGEWFSGVVIGMLEDFEKGVCF